MRRPDLVREDTTNRLSVRLFPHEFRGYSPPFVLLLAVLLVVCLGGQVSGGEEAAEVAIPAETPLTPNPLAEGAPVSAAPDSDDAWAQFGACLSDTWSQWSAIIGWTLLAGSIGIILGGIAGGWISAAFYLWTHRRGWQAMPWRWYRWMAWMMPVWWVILGATTGSLISGLSASAWTLHRHLREGEAVQRTVVRLATAAFCSRAEYEATHGGETIVAAGESVRGRVIHDRPWSGSRVKEEVRRAARASGAPGGWIEEGLAYAVGWGFERFGGRIDADALRLLSRLTDEEVRAAVLRVPSGGSQGVATAYVLVIDLLDRFAVEVDRALWNQVWPVLAVAPVGAAALALLPLLLLHLCRWIFQPRAEKT